MLKREVKYLIFSTIICCFKYIYYDNSMLPSVFANLTSLQGACKFHQRTIRWADNS